MSSPATSRVETLGPMIAALLVVLCAAWGLNHVLMKWAYKDISPLLSAGIRSIIATIGLIVWCRYKSIPLKSPGIHWIHGAVLGGFFSLEFLVLYIGLDLTLASRGAVLLYMQPVFTALGAHFFVSGEKLSAIKSLGLGLAFAGAAWVLTGQPPEGNGGQANLWGDFLCLIAGVSWAGINVYTKAKLVGRVSFYTALYWQLIYSIPVLFLAAFIMETPRLNLTWGLTGAMLYQGLVVATFSYLVFFRLIYRYAAAGVSSFTFLTPVFGVGFSMVILGDKLTFNLISGLVLVCSGVWLVNRKPRAKRGDK